ncbi:glycosyltransferase family 2 protein, partial [Chloroflexota bacterium]
MAPEEMDEITVSVMMPAYNAEAYIAQAIESVLVQSYTQWELVIVNDGSMDSTADIAAQYDDPRIRILHQANAGEATARNTALQNIQGEFVAFLDSDDFYLSDHLELTVNFLKKNPSFYGVYTDGFYCNENGDRLASLASRRRGPFCGRVFEQAVYSSDVFGPPVCVVLRSEIIQKHDLKFDPDIIIGPDWDFFIQFSDISDFGYLEHKTCCYRIHTKNLTSMTSLEKRALEFAKCRMK